MSDDDRAWAWSDDLPARPTHSPVAHGRLGLGFDGEKYPGGWGVEEDRIIDSILTLDYHTLRSRSHELFETNLYARGAVRRLVTNEVHTGLQLEANPVGPMLGVADDDDGLHDWANRTESFFGAWAGDYRVCDFEQRSDMNLGELTSAARREALVGGDVLVVLRQNEQTKLPTVQLIGGHMVDTPMNHEANIDHGVELDNAGRQIAYHVRRNTDPFTFETERIPAFDASGQRVAWLMYGTDRRVGQNRGTPLLAIVLQSLKEIDRYRDSTQRKAVIQSVVAMWIEKSEDKLGSLPMKDGAIRRGTVDTNNYDGTPRSFQISDQVPGMVFEEMQHGEKPHAFKADGGDTVQFPEFEGAIVAAIAWACEMPPEILRLSFDKNYSASQASLNEFKLYLSVVRARIAQAFNQPIYNEWLVASVRRGTIVAPGLVESTTDIAMFERYHAWTNADWIGAVKPVTDILKMAKAFEVLEAHGWTTNARIARELTGTKFQTNARILRREREELPLNEPPVDDSPEL